MTAGGQRPRLPRDAGELRERLIEAVSTLRRLPQVRNSEPVIRWAAWPEIVRRQIEAYGWNTPEATRLRASSEEIQRMDEVLGWIASHWSVAGLAGTDLPRDAGTVPWFRAAGWPWNRIAQLRRETWQMAQGVRLPWGNSRHSLERIERAALQHMLDRLAVLAPPEPEVEPRFEERVVVDYTTESRVVGVTRDGRAVVRTRHARARTKLVER